MRKNFLRNNIFYIILGIFLIAYVVSMLFMFAWGALTSLKDPFEYSINKIGLPESWMFSNYINAFTAITAKVRTANGFENVGVLSMYLNTVLYSFGCAFFSTFVSSIVAYLCAKYPYKLSKIVVVVVVVTMSLPIVGSTPSAIQVAKTFGLYDSIVGQWIMAGHFQTGVHFLVIYGAFESMPNAYIEAAEIDGASELQVMSRIMLPLIKNVFSTILLLRIVGLWNDYQTPLLYIPNKPTIAYGLFYFAKVNTLNQNFSVPMQITGSFLVCIPVFILFSIFQNKIMTNLSIGGIKG